jgi:pimeloyl-[acyl-carrier protein] synthase
MSAPPVAFDAVALNAPAFLANPYPFYQQLRDAAPVFWFPHGGPTGGMWLVTRYRDVSSLLKDNSLIKDITRVVPPEKLGREAANKDLLTSDPPDHTRLRALVNQAFTPQRIRALEPRITQIAAELLAQVRTAGAMEFMADFAIPLPVIVIAELLGVPAEDQHAFRAWSNDVMRSIDGIRANEEIAKKGEEAGLALAGYFGTLVAQRRAAPRDDLLSALIAAQDGGEQLSAEELVGMCQLLLIAGHETTVNLLGNGLLTLLQHREQWQLLQQHPELLPGAIEEMLRYESPVQRATIRFTGRSLAIAGQTLEPGQQVSAVIGAANRDPAHFPDPDRFDITRQPNRHLAFGLGIHFCLGAPLARTEARIGFGQLLANFPGMALATDTPDWSGNTFLRGLNSLPVTW